MRRVKLSNPFKTRIIDEKLIREHLALERTKLANERTLLAYIRASLYLLIGGLALLQIKEYPELHWLGYGAFSVSIIFLSVGVMRYIHLNRKLTRLLRPETTSENNES